MHTELKTYTIEEITQDFVFNELEGKGFEVFVKQGDTVKKGQEIGHVDFEQVRAAGFDPTIIVVVTNTGDYLDVIPMRNQKIQILDESMNIILG